MARDRHEGTGLRSAHGTVVEGIESREDRGHRRQRPGGRREHRGELEPSRREPAVARHLARRVRAERVDAEHDQVRAGGRRSGRGPLHLRRRQWPTRDHHGGGGGQRKRARGTAEQRNAEPDHRQRCESGRGGESGRLQGPGAQRRGRKARGNHDRPGQCRAAGRAPQAPGEATQDQAGQHPRARRDGQGGQDGKQDHQADPA